MSSSDSRSAGACPTSSSSGLSSAGPNRVAVVSSSWTNSRPRLVERLREQIPEQVDLDPLVAQFLGEGIVLLAGPLCPHHVVEEQLIDIVGGQPGQLEPWPVNDHLP